MGQQGGKGGKAGGGKAGGGKAGGKSGGKAGGGKTGGKQDKASKNSAKMGQKTGKNSAKNSKKSGNKSYSLVSSCLCVCVSIVYSIMIGYLGGAAIKTVGDNPQLLQMAAASDIRLKKHVSEVKYGMNEIMQLEPKSYHYINENNKVQRHIGLMAQDVSKIIPELVVELQPSMKTQFNASVSKETLYGIKYQEIVPVLINAIKELKQEIDDLKKQ
jgi:F0F1-type ATP synthase membrane subunit c/vacuolar-type H+-ATPase subunit K